jgi:hypothetical protein
MTLYITVEKILACINKQDISNSKTVWKFRKTVLMKYGSQACYNKLNKHIHC